MRREEMDLLELVRRIVEALESKEGEDTVVLDMRSTPIPTSYFVIVTANSKPHMKALKESVIEELEKNKVRMLYCDKGEDYDWLLIDAGEIVIHIFTQRGREFYDLEGLWIMAKRLIGV